MSKDRTHTPDEWRGIVAAEINRHWTDGPGDCMTWGGPVSRCWGHPLVFVEDAVCNVRQWQCPREKRKDKHVTFFKATCGNDSCIRIRHLSVVAIVPLATVKAMEALPAA